MLRAMALQEYVDGLFVYAMTLTRDSFEVEEQVQETYVRALAAVGRLRENSNLKAWLSTILRNVWINQVRQQRVAPNFFELDAHENSADLPMNRRAGSIENAGTSLPVTPIGSTNWRTKDE